VREKLPQAGAAGDQAGQQRHQQQYAYLRHFRFSLLCVYRQAPLGMNPGFIRGGDADVQVDGPITIAR
jgi:hypothetical protein